MSVAVPSPPFFFFARVLEESNQLGARPLSPFLSQLIHGRHLCWYFCKYLIFGLLLQGSLGKRCFHVGATSHEIKELMKRKHRTQRVLKCGGPEIRGFGGRVGKLLSHIVTREESKEGDVHRHQTEESRNFRCLSEGCFGIIGSNGFPASQPDEARVWVAHGDKFFLKTGQGGGRGEATGTAEHLLMLRLRLRELPLLPHLLQFPLTLLPLTLLLLLLLLLLLQHLLSLLTLWLLILFPV